MKFLKNLGWIAVIIWIAAIVALSIGWVLNVIDIIHSNFSAIDGMLIVRIIGVFVAPLGGVLGYF